MISRIIVAADFHLSAQSTPSGKPLQPTLAERFVDYCQQANPDAVVIVGDLVDSGNPAEYDLACKLLKPIQSRCYLGIGNHELLQGDIAQWSTGTGQRPCRALEIGPLPATILNSGIENLPRTQWGGRADELSLQMVHRQLRLYRDLPHFIFTHHPLVGTVRRSEETMMGLDNTLDLFNQLKQHPHDIVIFSGHTHVQSCVQTGNMICIGLPPIFFWPHALLVVEYSMRHITVQTVSLVDHPDESPDPAAADPAHRLAVQPKPNEMNFSFVLR